MQDSDCLLGGRGVRQRLGERFAEQRAVQQPGEGVEVHEVLQTALRLDALSDVARDGDDDPVGSRTLSLAVDLDWEGGTISSVCSLYRRSPASTRDDRVVQVLQLSTRSRHQVHRSELEQLFLRVAQHL